MIYIYIKYYDINIIIFTRNYNIKYYILYNFIFFIKKYIYKDINIFDIIYIIYIIIMYYIFLIYHRPSLSII